jgi:Lon-like ATP-dependent protease
MLCGAAAAAAAFSQAVLEERSPVERLQKALLLVSKERELTNLQAEIKTQVEAKMSKTQRDYFLNEQLKSIKKELGLEKDDKDALVQKFQDRVKAAVGLPDKARKVSTRKAGGTL